MAMFVAVANHSAKSPRAGRMIATTTAAMMRRMSGSVRLRRDNMP